ncbi:MAG: hypothetical protein HY908_32735 [Myxococcales bacterium]|nr:hypothetical protein [Myxococcales bacterium]
MRARTAQPVRPSTAARAARTARLGLALAALGLAGACQPSATVDPAEYLARARLQIDQRLAGHWKLVSFVPGDTLSPVMAALLSFQFDRLRVEFRNGHMYASSPGIRTERRYRIDQPQGDLFRLVMLDEQDIDYHASCELDQAGRLVFQSETSPWKGRGVLAREDAALP